MFTIKYTKSFEKDFKHCKQRGYEMEALNVVMQLLEKDGALPAQYKPHRLSGKYNRRWECHIKPNWLLVWDKNDTELTLLLMRTGTHSDIFG